MNWLVEFCFWVGGLAALTGIPVIAWGLFLSDVGRGTRRCPECWHGMEGVPGRKCPECAAEARSERDMHRTKRSWSIVVMGLCLLLLGRGIALTPRVVKYGPWAIAPSGLVIGGIRYGLAGAGKEMRRRIDDEHAPPQEIMAAFRASPFAFTSDVEDRVLGNEDLEIAAAEFLPWATHALGSESGAMHRFAAAGISHLAIRGNQTALHQFPAMIADKDPTVRINALTVLSTMTEVPSLIVDAALAQLEVETDREALVPLLSVAGDRRACTRWTPAVGRRVVELAGAKGELAIANAHALNALSFCADEGRSEPVEAMVRSGVPADRLVGLVVLRSLLASGRVSNQWAGDLARPFLADPDPEVRRAAEQVMRRAER